MGREDILFQKGIKAFNERNFYDAHEYWEELWLDYKLEDSKFIQKHLDDFCTQRVASGGRIGFAGTCTPEQILENMKKDQQKLLTYQKI